MSVSLQSIGVSGIFAAEAEMAATESNISNASNPNYAVESVNLEANAGYGGIGDGVSILGTVSAQAPYLTSQINSNQSTDSYNQAFSLATTDAQQALAPSSGNDLSGSLQSLFNAFTNLSASPADATVRSSAIAAITQFAQTDQSLSSSLSSIANSQLTQVSSLVSQVNDASTQIAKLNSQITADQANGQSGAALEDQRNALVNQLATLIGASGDAQGNVSVGGMPLVSGTSALTLATVGSGPSLGLQVNLANGSLPVNVSQIGGTLGGVLAGATSVLQLQSQVNELSTSVAGALNTQAESGYGLDGSTGTALFTIPGSGGPVSVNSALTEQNLGASATASGVPGDGSNASALAAIGNNQNLIASLPNSTPVAAFSEITSNFGTVVQNANNNQQQSAATVQSLTQLQSSITGVSLNDQLTQLIQYQNALEASGRAVQAADDMTTYLVQSLSSSS
jgi:flagellar hook-associated protein 1 FlgK